jgi:DNA-binding transcriptional ArsR family regulator
MNKLIPISSSILRNRRELGDAIWTFLWMINRTTQVRTCQDGKFEGLVSDGEKMKVELIAEDLRLSPNAVRRHIKVLQKAGLVRKMGSRVPSGFALAAEPVGERVL